VWLCTALQVVGLLASEHAVTVPVLLAVIVVCTQPRDRWRRLARDIVPSVLVVAAYGLAKIWYFVRVRPVYPGYRMGFDIVVWLQHLGQYAVACFNVATLLPGVEAVSAFVGGALVALLAISVWQALRRRGPWSLLAAGLAIFVVSLAPVFPLRTHYKDHYIALAALGLALALVAACQFVTRRWRGLTVSIAAAALLLDVASSGRAWRQNPTFALVTNGGDYAAAWVQAVIQAARTDGRGSAVLVPNNPVTASVFVLGQAQDYFPSLPSRVILVKPGTPAASSTPGVMVERAEDLPPDAPLPGWEPRWAALRWLARTEH
jgi:hypothetical protein